MVRVIIGSLLATVALAGIVKAGDYTPEPKYSIVCMVPDTDSQGLANVTSADLVNGKVPYILVKLDDEELIHPMTKGELCGLLPQE